MNRSWLAVLLLAPGCAGAPHDVPRGSRVAAEAPITLETTIHRSSGIPPAEIARRVRRAR